MHVPFDSSNTASRKLLQINIPKHKHTNEAEVKINEIENNREQKTMKPEVDSMKRSKKTLSISTSTRKREGTLKLLKSKMKLRTLRK